MKEVFCSVVGDVSSGKASLIISYVVGRFEDDWEAIGNMLHFREIKVHGKDVRMQMRYTSAEDGSVNETLRGIAYCQSSVFLLVYDPYQRDTLHNISERWLPEIERQGRTKKVPKILVGIQGSLEGKSTGVTRALHELDRVSHAEATRFALEHGLSFAGNICPEEDAWDSLFSLVNDAARIGLYYQRKGSAPKRSIARLPLEEPTLFSHAQPLAFWEDGDEHLRIFSEFIRNPAFEDLYRSVMQTVLFENHLQILENVRQNMLLCEDYADCELVLDCGTHLPVHSCLLEMNGPYFQALFSERWKKKESKKKKEYHLHDLTDEDAKAFLEFCYTQTIRPSSTFDPQRMMAVADMFGLTRLAKTVDCLSAWLVVNAFFPPDDLPGMFRLSEEICTQVEAPICQLRCTLLEMLTKRNVDVRRLPISPKELAWVQMRTLKVHGPSKAERLKKALLPSCLRRYDG